MPPHFRFSSQAAADAQRLNEELANLKAELAEERSLCGTSKAEVHELRVTWTALEPLEPSDLIQAASATSEVSRLQAELASQSNKLEQLQAQLEKQAVKAQEVRAQTLPAYADTLAQDLQPHWCATLAKDVQACGDSELASPLKADAFCSRPIVGRRPAAASLPALPKAISRLRAEVCVCGGSGGIGQPLSLLMAMDDNVGELSVYDLDFAMVPPGGVAADLNHLEKKVQVKGYVKSKEEKAIDVLGDCLKGCNLVLVPAGLPRKPGQTRDDLFKINAGIAKEVVEACAKYCPDAVIALIVNPVNSVVPAMAELYKKKGLDPKKIVGVTTLDGVRANKFVAELTGEDPKNIEVPVIGGHAGVTIMPVFSQDKHAAKIAQSEIPALDKHVQDAGTDVVNAKNGKGSATLSMAYAGARLGKAVLAGMAGTPTTECAYVMSDVEPGCPYFTSKARR
ncbi:unnamed protein product [Symbiodinium natans]|uniref:malate dehydrogenase n=1 Tax=Symbiodinium natans TaxID=878477 RepID=A0A812RRP6_9DINO|nr:unnamed protein product [Symbiodinium natans]